MCVIDDTLFASTKLEISWLQLLPHLGRVVLGLDRPQFCNIVFSVARKDVLLQSSVVLIEIRMVQTLGFGGCVEASGHVLSGGKDAGVVGRV